MEKLQQQNIYPIVILIKFKSVKHIKEINIWDARGGTGHQDKPSMKDAKNMQELSLKVEQDYKHLISDTVQAGANIMLICAQVKPARQFWPNSFILIFFQVAAKIDQEQKRPIWIQSGTIWWY